MLSTFAVGFLGLLLVAALWMKHPHLSQYRGSSRILIAAMVCGASSSFFLSIVVCTLTPSLVTVENDLSYTKEFSFFSNGEFIGIGGSYIANNSAKTLRLVGINENDDVNVVIPARCIKKVRICPEVFFKPLPKREHKRVFVSRGKLKYNAPPSVFLIEY